LQLVNCWRCQVRANFRTAITIPERSWVRFRDVIAEFAARQQTPPATADRVAGVDRVVSGVGDAGDGDKDLSSATAATASLPVDTTATATADNSH